MSEFSLLLGHASLIPKPGLAKCLFCGISLLRLVLHNHADTVYITDPMKLIHSQRSISCPLYNSLSRICIVYCLGKLMYLTMKTHLQYICYSYIDVLTLHHFIYSSSESNNQSVTLSASCGERISVVCGAEQRFGECIFSVGNVTDNCSSTAQIHCGMF